MSVNIGLLVAVTIASIFVLMFGEFEGKLVRTFTTLLLFALFTGFAALDASRDRPPRHVQISQIGQMYMLGLALVLIWGSLAVNGWYRKFHDDWTEGPQLVFSVLLIVAIVKGAVLLIRLISDWAVSPHRQLALGAKAAAALIGLLAVLFTLPVGTGYALTFPDGYWRLTVAVLLLTGLAISVSVLLLWSFREPKQPVARGPEPQPQAVPEAPRAAAPAPSAPDPSRFASPAGTQQRPAPSMAPPPQYAPPVRGTRPWPVFPDGQPLPAAANGRPDFAALQYIASIYVESERQWHGS